MGETPAQPVVGYVGYALKEPWGQPRAVIGFSAEEAERLAEFLERGISDRGPVDAALEFGRSVVPDQSATPHLRAVSPLGAPPAMQPDILAVTSQLPGSQRRYSFPSGSGATMKESRFGAARPRPEPVLAG
jgi:hypothetical protein